MHSCLWGETLNYSFVREQKRLQCQIKLRSEDSVHRYVIIYATRSLTLFGLRRDLPLLLLLGGPHLWPVSVYQKITWADFSNCVFKITASQIVFAIQGTSRHFPSVRSVYIPGFANYAFLLRFICQSPHFRSLCKQVSWPDETFHLRNDYWRKSRYERIREFWLDSCGLCERDGCAVSFSRNTLLHGVT